MIFVVKKQVFIMMFVKKGNFENITMFFFQNFIFDQAFDSNGPGGPKWPKRLKIIKFGN